MAVDVEIRETGAVRGVEQIGRLREANQDVGLRRAASARLAAFRGNSLVERRNPTAGFLQLRPQHLERGAVILLQGSERLQDIGHEGRARVGRILLD